LRSFAASFLAAAASFLAAAASAWGLQPLCRGKVKKGCPSVPVGAPQQCHAHAMTTYKEAEIHAALTCDHAQYCGSPCGACPRP